MLVLTRKVGESLTLGDMMLTITRDGLILTQGDATIIVSRRTRASLAVKVAVDAPAEFRVVRSELPDRQQPVDEDDAHRFTPLKGSN